MRMLFMLLGGATISTPSPEMAVTSGNVEIFYRLMTEDLHVYHSAKYGRVSKQNSYTIAFVDDNQTLKFGQIQQFAILSGNCVAIVRLFTIPENSS